jgi:hypothetical protein
MCHRRGVLGCTLRHGGRRGVGVQIERQQEFEASRVSLAGVRVGRRSRAGFHALRQESGPRRRSRERDDPGVQSPGLPRSPCFLEACSRDEAPRRRRLHLLSVKSMSSRGGRARGSSARRWRPRMVLLDLQRAGLGAGATHQGRPIDAANAMNGDQRAAFEAGCDAYLSKPSTRARCRPSLQSCQ